jgi:hypothetical protein
MSDNIYNLIQQYLLFVWKYNNNTMETENFEDYVMEDFRFSAGNNWVDGFDFVDWFFGEDVMYTHYGATSKGKNLDNVMNFAQTCRAINRIKNFYEEGFGDAETLLKDMTPENILRHLVYVDLYEKSFEEICELLEIDELTDEEKQAFIDRR